MPLDLYICRLSSRTALGHNAYTMHTCVQCANAFAACTVCPPMGELCPGCRHAERLAQIAAGEVVCPATLGGPGVGQPATAVGGGRAEVVVDQAEELAHVDQAGVVCTTTCSQDSNQAAMLAAGRSAVYNPGMLTHADIDPGVGVLPVDTHTSPLVLLVLPVDLAGVQPVLQALVAVMTPQALGGHRNGHGEAGGQRLPRHLAQKCYLSDTACPSGHTYTDTGKVLRYHGNNQCVPCRGQRKPRPKGATTAATEG